MTNKQDQKFLSTLTDDQAQRVLHQLLRTNSSLIPKAAVIAREILSGIDEEKISDRVCSTLSGLDVHDLWAESGKTRHGYVDPYEHSYEMMENIIEPFLEEMERYMSRKMLGEAMACCRGIIRGICIYMFEEADEFADWAVDSEDNLSYEVIIRWKKKNTDPEVIAELEAWRNTCLKCE